MKVFKIDKNEEFVVVNTNRSSIVKDESFGKLSLWDEFCGESKD